MSRSYVSSSGRIVERDQHRRVDLVRGSEPAADGVMASSGRSLGGRASRDSASSRLLAEAAAKAGLLLDLAHRRFLLALSVVKLALSETTSRRTRGGARSTISTSPSSRRRQTSPPAARTRSSVTSTSAASAPRAPSTPCATRSRRSAQPPARARPARRPRTPPASTGCRAPSLAASCSATTASLRSPSTSWRPAAACGECSRRLAEQRVPLPRPRSGRASSGSGSSWSSCVRRRVAEASSRASRARATGAARARAARRSPAGRLRGASAGAFAASTSRSSSAT